jgi:hypothetical protein
MPFAQKPTPRLSPSGMESRIRRAAEKQGLRAVKSRWRRGTKENRGGWMLVDPIDEDRRVAGFHYDLSDADVLDLLS